MQERELRKGSIRRCGAEGPGSHWPSNTGADPAAPSGVPPATVLDCKPVRGRNTGVGMSVGDGLSASLPPVVFPSGLPPETNAVRVQVTQTAVRSRKQRKGVGSAGSGTRGDKGAHHCRMLCA
eukprot:719010-Pleurochrysis_carterae.AAC.3